MKLESEKGYNKCKDNHYAFLQHKQGSLFPRKGVMDQYVIEKERKEAVEMLEKRIKEIA